MDVVGSKKGVKVVLLEHLQSGAPNQPQTLGRLV